MAFGKLSEHVGGGSYLNARDHVTTLGLLVEPKGKLLNQPHQAQNGEQITRDIFIADVAVFKDQRAIDNGQPTEILKGVRITAKYLARDGIALLDAGVEAVPLKIDRTTLKNGATPFVWRDLDSNSPAYEAISAYYQAREASAAEFASDFD